MEDRDRKRLIDLESGRLRKKKTEQNLYVPTSKSSSVKFQGWSRIQSSNVERNGPVTGKLQKE